jgi:8-oxo-dGTP diphosphatase
MSTAAVVRVGVGCFITSPQYPLCTLLGVRKGSHGAGKLALPGGHLEVGESWEECARREVKVSLSNRLYRLIQRLIGCLVQEETNLDIENLSYVYATNDPHIDNNPEKHYITLFMHATISSTSPALELLEPHKCEGWKWMPYAELQDISKNRPEILFDPMNNFLESKGAQILKSYF